MKTAEIISAGHEALSFFLYAMVELTILFIGISFLVGVINEFLPREKVKQLLSGRQGKGYLLGSLLGGLTPFCSCSTIPMMVGLLKAGAGFGPTMSFLFASPLVNPILIGLFLTLFGAQVTVLYSGMALTLAIFSGFFLEKAGFERYLRQQAIGDESTACVCNQDPQSLAQLQPLGSISQFSTIAPQVDRTSASCCTAILVMQAQHENRWQRIFKEALKQFRTFLPYIIIGVAIGSLIHGFLPADLVTRVAGENNSLAIPVSAVIGIPLYIRASTILPIASSLVAKGMSFGAVIALIIGGAGASLPEVAMLKGLFRLPLLAAFLFSVFFMAVASGLVMNAVLSPLN